MKLLRYETVAVFPSTRVPINDDGEREWPGLGQGWTSKNRYSLADSLIADDADILDAACGSGCGAAYLAHDDRRVVGVDTEKSCYEFAAAMHGSSDALGFNYGDVQSLPFLGGLFDAVVSVETLEHVESPEDALREFARVLRSGGLLFLTTPNGDNRRAGGCHHHKHLFRDDDLAKLLRPSFKDLQWHRVPGCLESLVVTGVKR